MRYPTPGTVAMSHGSPSRLRSADTVMRTALVNGSAFSSQARSSSSSALTIPPGAEHLAPERIEPQTTDLADRWPCVRAPASERPQPQHQFPQLERLREVV